MNSIFRKAELSETPQIWEIIQQAIFRRKQEGSKQWQDGYPNENVIKQDIEKGNGYVLTIEGKIAAYAAVIFNDEPAYANIEGKWLTNQDFIVVHRVAVSNEYLGRGLAQRVMYCIEDVAIKNNIFSIKIDTNFDNAPMLNIFNKLGYTYCGEVNLNGGIRKAFEKILSA